MRRFDEYLPYVPSQQETWHFISTMPGLKQKAMVALMYSSGLRIGEVCSLRYEDVSRSRIRVFIRHGKNRQSRYAILSTAALDILSQYWLSCGRPTGYLFPKQSGRNEPIGPFILSAPTFTRTAPTCSPSRPSWGISRSHLRPSMSTWRAMAL